MHNPNVHLFYFDEAGCNGEALTNPEQPVFVLGGVSVSDKKWAKSGEMRV